MSPGSSRRCRESLAAWLPATHERGLVGASVFRVIAGLVILYEYLINYHQRGYLYGPSGVWPYAETLRQASEEQAFSLYALVPSPLFFELVFHLGLLVTTLWVVGLGTRWMTVLTAVWFWSLHQRNPVLWDGGDNIIQIVLVYAVFANLGAYFSLDAERKRGRLEATGTGHQMKALLHNAAMLAVAVQLCLLYGTAGLYKVQGEAWRNGTAIYYIFRVGDFSWPGRSDFLRNNAYAVTALTYGTVALQLSFPFMFFSSRRARRVALASTALFHLGTAVLMGLVTFAAFMISIELSLVSDQDYRAVASWAGRLWRRRTRE